jgi:hypothetical protein
MIFFFRYLTEQLQKVQVVTEANKVSTETNKLLQLLFVTNLLLSRSEHIRPSVCQLWFLFIYLEVINYACNYD